MFTDFIIQFVQVFDVLIQDIVFIKNHLIAWNSPISWYKEVLPGFAPRTLINIWLETRSTSPLPRLRCILSFWDDKYIMESLLVKYSWIHILKSVLSDLRFSRHNLEIGTRKCTTIPVSLLFRLAACVGSAARSSAHVRYLDWMRPK